jgi:hypothetical protein
LSARDKLNAAYFQGALVIAAILGALTESFSVFWIALAGLLERQTPFYRQRWLPTPAAHGPPSSLSRLRAVGGRRRE